MDSDEERNPRPRLCVDISPKEQKRLQELIPWGLQNAIIRTLVDGMLNLIEEFGEVAIALLLTGKISTLDVIKAVESKVERRKHGDSRPEEEHI